MTPDDLEAVFDRTVDLVNAWTPVAGWEGLYEVNPAGQVRSLRRSVTVHAKGRRPYQRTYPGKIMTAVIDGSGYPAVALSDNGHQRLKPVHVILLETFVGPRPQGFHACHDDGDRRNSTLANLRWDSASANQLDKVAHGTHPEARKTHCPQGHEYNAANARVRPSKSGTGTTRQCRVCDRLKKRALRAVAA
jgi:hypothetical protein